MSTEIAFHPFFLRLARNLGTKEQPRFPTALEFALLLVQREVQLTRLDARLATAETDLDAAMDRENFFRFWKGEYARAFAPRFREEIEEATRGPSNINWTELRSRVGDEIRQMIESHPKEGWQAGQWLSVAFNLFGERSPTERADRLRKANHQAMEAYPLGEDRSVAYAANFRENDPAGYGTRLWIWGERVEMLDLLMELELMEPRGELTCARLESSNAHPLHGKLVSAYLEGAAPTCQPVPEAEAAWERRTTTLRATIERGEGAV